MSIESGEWLAKAESALIEGDKRAAQVLLRKALELDFNNPQAWAMLHTHYGSGKPFHAFKREFTRKYFPYESYSEQHLKRREYVEVFGKQQVPRMAGLIAGLLVGQWMIGALILLLGRGTFNIMAISCLASPSAFVGMLVGALGSRIGKKLTGERNLWIYGAVSGGLSSLLVTPIVLWLVGSFIQLASGN